MVGKTIKQYRVEELLGKGGMGVVYRAQDQKLNRPVALKVLKPELTNNPDRLRRFFQEARSAAAIQHPAIAQVYDIDEVDGTTFIAMEFVEGETVSKLISKRELDLIGSVEIALQVTEGLSKAHDSKIIHRDIKSDNIMVTRDGHAKLLDFGLAKLLEPQAGEEGTQTWPNQTRTQTLGQTMAGTVLGTIAYMSPEQARGQELSFSSDIFSLGIVLYEMVTGELPFKGESPLDTMHAIAFDEVRPVTVIRKNLPPELHRIVSRCLRKRPEDRYPDCPALAADLKRLKADIESGVRRPRSAGHKLDEIKYWLQTSLSINPYIVLIAAAVLIAAGILFFTNVQWVSLVWPVVIGLLIYRYIKNRKPRMLKGLVSKIAKFEDVRAVRIHGDQIIISVDKAPAKLYIRVNSLVDEINRRLYIAKPVEAAVRDDMSTDEFQTLLRGSNIVYVRDDIVLESQESPQK
jgi:serine/threonine protein kinase